MNGPNGTVQQRAAWVALQQIGASHHGHRREQDLVNYCLNDPLVNFNQNNINAAHQHTQWRQNYLAGQLQNYSRVEQRPGIPTHTRSLRKDALDNDYTNVFMPALREGRVFVTKQLMGQQNIDYIQLYGESPEHELNMARARLSHAMNPFYFPNILQSMLYTNRPAHYTNLGGGHCHHFSCPAFRMGHDLDATPMPIVNAFNPIHDMSNFTDTAAWVGANYDFWGNGQDRSTVPPMVDRLTYWYRNWLPNFEPLPTRMTIQGRIDANIFTRHVINPVRDWLWWDAARRDAYFNRLVNSFCPIPGNWVEWRYMAFQGHHYDYQIRRCNAQLPRYGQVRADNEMNLPGRVHDLTANLDEVQTYLQSGGLQQLGDGEIDGTMLFHYIQTALFFTNTACLFQVNMFMDLPIL